MKQGQNGLNFQCRTVYTALANCPRYNIEMNQYALPVHQLAYFSCEHASCGYTRRPLSPLQVPAVCADLYFEIVPSD